MMLPHAAVFWQDLPPGHEPVRLSNLLVSSDLEYRDCVDCVAVR